MPSKKRDKLSGEFSVAPSKSGCRPVMSLTLKPTAFIINSSEESDNRKVAAMGHSTGRLEMTRFRIQVWCDVSGERAYILDTYGTREEAECAARKCCSRLPYSFEVEEEPAVDYVALVA
jgi:hypothetical protein